MPPDNTDDDKLEKLRRIQHEVLMRTLSSNETDYGTEQSFLEDDKSKINKSNTGTILHLHKLLRIGMSVLFFLAVMVITYTVGILAWMIFAYVSDLISCPEELKEQLKHIWTVLSGAFLVLFFQFVANIGKKISSNGFERN